MNKLDKHTYQIDKIVVGGCLSSLLYAFYNNASVIFTETKKPFMFDNIDLRDIKHFKAPRGVKIPQVELWEGILFNLGLNGKLLTSDLARVIRLEEDNTLKITTEHSRMARVKFKELIIFEPEQVSGLMPFLESAEDKHVVIDWFNAKKGAKHTKNYLSFDDDFLKEVWFYTGDRVPNPTYRDCVVRSYLTRGQISDFDYSEAIARISLEQKFGDLGFVSTSKLDHAGREIYWDISYTFPEMENIKVVKYSPEQVLQDNIDTKIENKYVALLSFSRDSSDSIAPDRIQPAVG